MNCISAPGRSAAENRLADPGIHNFRIPDASDVAEYHPVLGCVAEAQDVRVERAHRRLKYEGQIHLRVVSALIPGIIAEASEVSLRAEPLELFNSKYSFGGHFPLQSFV